MVESMPVQKALAKELEAFALEARHESWRMECELSEYKKMEDDECYD